MSKLCQENTHKNLRGMLLSNKSQSEEAIFHDLNIETMIPNIWHSGKDERE